MLDSIPIPLRSILWPLAGAVLILAFGRFLPNWVRRLLAVAASLASLTGLWSLRAGPLERVEVVWEPLHFFRMSPALNPDGLSLLLGVVLAGVTAALVLGIRAREPQKTVWHGLMLVGLAGCLIATLAENLLALALGSALVDLTLIAVVIWTANGAEPAQRMPLSVTVPGIASTIVLFLAALKMDTDVGHASLLSPNLNEGALILVGVAGVLRSLVFPLHPRELNTPEGAASLLLPVGVGGYLLARSQSLLPVLSGQPWTMALAEFALLAGGLLAWSSHRTVPDGKRHRLMLGKFWSGTLAHQTAAVLGFALLLVDLTPWPLIGLMLALGILVIWWDGSLEEDKAAGSGRSAWIQRWMGSWLDKARSSASARVPVLQRFRDSWLGRNARALAPAIALGSLAGLPLTVGARGRWYLYAAWLENGDSLILVGLAADTFLAVGLWIALALCSKQARDHRMGATTLLATLVLVIPLLVWGIVPGAVGDGFGLESAKPVGVSIWGLGLLYLLPWLLGVWLARMTSRLQGTLDRVYDAVNLDWLFRTAGWVGQRLVGGVNWIGKVGEGEGWWGWVLIILAIGIVLLGIR
ncbi:MAG TPA: hypothetical protein VLY63_24190 [Anaerolineae bacterium]|nr:hypothetical protein [Anaerolineae bacterium]